MPFTFRDRYDHKKACKHRFHIMESYRKNFEEPLSSLEIVLFLKSIGKVEQAFEYNFGTGWCPPGLKSKLRQPRFRAFFTLRQMTG